MNTQLAVSPVAQAMQVVGDSNKSSIERANGFGIAIDHYAAGLLSILPKHVSLEKMKQMFVLQLKQTPKLLDCEFASLMKAVYTACSLGLEPDPYMGQLYLIPFGKQVQVIPGYKGLLRLVRNTGEVVSINAETLYEKDDYKIDLMNPNNCYHNPYLGKGSRGDIIGFYAKAQFKDEGTLPQIQFMNCDQVNAIRDESAGFKRDKTGGPWGKHYGEMGNKTVLRRLIKNLPISTERRELIGRAEQLDNLAHQGYTGYVDKETGEVMGGVDIFAASDSGEEAGPLPQGASALDAFAQGGADA